MDTKFEVTDAGEFVESNYRCEESSSLYGKLIGRRKVTVPSQKAFSTADIALEGYLKKEGSWRKSWKTRYFILRKDIRTLCVFTSKEDFSLIGAIPLDRNCVVYSDVRSFEDEQHIFGVKLAADRKPEILMSAPDEETKRMWLDALIRESQRTDEVVMVDWWSDLFGDVPVLDGKAFSEVVRQRRLAGDSGSGRAVAAAEAPSTVDSTAVEEAATTEDMSGMARLALQSFAEPRQEEDFAGDMDTVRLAMPDQDSDDELDEAPAPAMPLLGAQKSIMGSTQFVDSPREEADSRPASCEAPALGKDISNSSQTTREASSSVSHMNSDERMGSSMSPAKSQPGKYKDKKKDHMKKALESVSASEAKDGKVKPVGAAPLQYPSAQRHETRFGFSGLKISMRIENMCQYMDRFFLVLFAGYHITGAPAGAPPEVLADRSTGNNGLSWIPLSRTEEICVEEKPEYGESVIRVSNEQFSLLQGPMENETASHFMFILFRNEHQKANGGTGYNFADHVLVSKATVKREYLNTDAGLFKFDMTIMSDRFLDLSASPWMVQKSKITLGVAVMSSPKLTLGRELLRRSMNSTPYGEAAYGLRTSAGQVLALEQLFVAKYSITVPQSFLSLVFVERMQQMSDVALVARDDCALHTRNLNELSNDILRDYFADTTTAPPKVPQRLFDQPSCFNNFTEVSPDSLGMTELTSRVAALKKLCSVLEKMNRIVFEYYENSYRHYLRISAGGVLKNAVIGAEFSGSFLRRSVWKKTPTWQFAPVNLNLQVLLTQPVSVSELKAKSETLRVADKKRSASSDFNVPTAAPSSETAADTRDDVKYFPSITHGAFAAHSLGFNDGGLRRLFSRVTPDEARLDWMQTLQVSGGLRYSALEPLIKEFPDHAESLFSLTSHPDDPAEFYSRAFNLALRIDICLSQALAHACTCLKTLIMMASLGLADYVDKLKCALLAGYLIPIESLLSSQGHEMGMIEDLDGILPLLNSVSFRFVKAAGEANVPGTLPKPPDAGGAAGDIHSANVHRDVKGRLVVDLAVSAEEEAVLRACAAETVGYEQWSSSSAYRYERSCKPKEPPRCNYKIGHAIPDIIVTVQVFAVVFTQGVNEMQTLANMSGEAYKQSLINVDSVAKLQAYVAGYVDVLKYFHAVESEKSGAEVPVRGPGGEGSPDGGGENATDASIKIEEITRLYKELDKTVQITVNSPNEKNVNVLLNASRIGRYISGCMSILCKSGKDRTSMSVTLEQARYLSEANEVQHGKDLCRVMRRHGVRRMNVWANTGQSLYAFNSIQRQILPTCYAPPEGTFSGSVMS